MPAPKGNKYGKNGGRPTKYNKKYCDAIIKFFNKKPTCQKKVEIVDKLGRKHLIKVEKPIDLPTLEGFSNKIGVVVSTLWEWAKIHEEFSNAVKKAKECEKNILVQNGLLGRYDSSFAKFVASNFTDMREKQEVKHTGDTLADLLLGIRDLE